MSNIDWNLVLETIRADRCVLLLGPELAQTADQIPITEALMDSLDLENDDNLKDLKYYPADSLFQYKDPVLRTRTYFKIKSFYRELGNNFYREVYEKLGEIAFHVAIAVTHDHFMTSVMQSYKIPHQFAFYNKTVNPPELEAPSQSLPLVYNLFGSIEEEQSMILSHNDLYDFLFAILGDRSLPGELQNALHDAANILFIGFNFEKWYMQLLLRMLNLHDSKFKFDRYASTGVLNVETQQFCNDQFKINFVEGGAIEFVNTLYQKCQEEGLLRNLGEPDSTMAERVIRYLEEDLIDDAINLMNQFFTDKEQEDLREEVILLTGRYKRLKRKINQEVIEADQADLETNKIRMALLEINKEVKALE